jgi:hypothetical protein
VLWAPRSISRQFLSPPPSAISLSTQKNFGKRFLNFFNVNFRKLQTVFFDFFAYYGRGKEMYRLKRENVSSQYWKEKRVPGWRRKFFLGKFGPN